MTKTSLYEYELSQRPDVDAGAPCEEFYLSEEQYSETHSGDWHAEAGEDDALALPMFSFLGASTITAIAGAFTLAHGGASVSHTILFCITWVIGTCMLLVLGDQVFRSEPVLRALKRSLVCRVGGSICCAFAALCISVVAYQVVDGPGAVQANTAGAAISAQAEKKVAAPAVVKPAAAEPVKRTIAASAAPQSVHYRREHVSHTQVQALALPTPVAPSHDLLNGSVASRPAPQNTAARKEVVVKRQRAVAALSIDPNPLQTLSEVDPEATGLSLDPKPAKSRDTASANSAKAKPRKRKQLKRQRTGANKRKTKRAQAKRTKARKKTLRRTAQKVVKDLKRKFSGQAKKTGEATITPASARPRVQKTGRAADTRDAF